MNKRFYLPLCFFGLLLSVSICFAYFYDYEPNMLSKNLRLAGIGNLDLVIIERINEINAYDYGESPAGAVSDNKGQSEICIPFLYGFTLFGDTVYNRGWYAGAGAISGIFRPGKKIALGGSFSKTKAVEESASYVPTSRSERDVMRYSLMAGWNVLSRLSIGFRGAYHKLTEEDSSFYGTYLDVAKVTCFEPSLLISSGSGNWQGGFDYKYKKYSREYGDTVIHEFAIPIIHSSSNLDMGIRATLGAIPDSGLLKSVNVRSIYKLPFGNEHVNFGFQLGYVSPPPHIMDDFYYWDIPGYQTNMGFGMAYLNEGFGLLGIQYKKEISTFTEVVTPYSIHKNCLGIGTEIRLLKIVPVRFGYTNISYDYGYGGTSYYDVITWGLGIQFPDIGLKVDFCHNLYVYKYGYWNDETDYDHTFGLAGYFDF